MADTKKIKTALISVYHKDGLESILQKLDAEGVKLLSTGGTQSFIESLGYKVVKLDRVYFAGLTKKNLRRGQWRFLTDKELAILKMGSYE